MCLNCGCGEPTTNHGDPLNITLSRLRLVAQRNHSTLYDQAVNILATLIGDIKKSNPRGKDKMEVKKIYRTKVAPKMEAKYVDRTREKRIKANSD